ncbi:hypothetical protein QF050_001616 [Arthrobacter sp. SLBN-112]|nr:hypothetical protein [Arthrobacter sp. SLBN-112]
MTSTPPVPNASTPQGSTVFSRGSYAEALRIGEILRKETVGGALLVIAAGYRPYLGQLPGVGELFCPPGSPGGLCAVAPGTEPGGLGG